MPGRRKTIFDPATNDELAAQLEEARRKSLADALTIEDLRRQLIQARRFTDQVVNMILDTHVELWGKLGRPKGEEHIRQVVRYRKKHTAEETAAAFHMTKRGIDKLMQRARRDGYA
jgi:hypothetical protein